MERKRTALRREKKNFYAVIETGLKRASSRVLFGKGPENAFSDSWSTDGGTDRGLSLDWASSKRKKILRPSV